MNHGTSDQAYDVVLHMPVELVHYGEADLLAIQAHIAAALAAARREGAADALDDMAEDMDTAASGGGLRRQVVNLVARRLAVSLRDRAAALRVTA